MKTNANAKIVIKAVENVSANMYDNNVIFRKYPEKLTKNVIRFTLRTKDATKAGSLITKAGLRQPKANWEVHQNVMNEIFALNPRPNIYVDTIFGRQFNENPVMEEQTEPIIDTDDNDNEISSNSNENRTEDNGGENGNEPVMRVKRKYTRHAVAVSKVTGKPKRKYTKHKAEIKAKRKYTRHAVVGKRKYTKKAGVKAKRKYLKKNGQPSMNKMIAALKHVLSHPELI